MAMSTPERDLRDLEESLVAKLQDLKYEYRCDIRDRSTLEANFRKRFDALNRVTLTDDEFHRLLEEIVKPNVYEAARSRSRTDSLRADLAMPRRYPVALKHKNTRHMLSFNEAARWLAPSGPCSASNATVPTDAAGDET